MFTKQTQNEWPFDFEANDQVAMSFDCWLALSTMDLCDSAVARLTLELREHYEAAYSDALLMGKSKEEAACFAVGALGSPYQANKRYKKSYVTVEQIKGYEYMCVMHKSFGYPNKMLFFVLAISLISESRHELGWQAGSLFLIAATCVFVVKNRLRDTIDRPLSERVQANILPDILWFCIMGYLLLLLSAANIIWGIAIFSVFSCFFCYSQTSYYRHIKRIEDEMTIT